MGIWMCLIIDLFYPKNNVIIKKKGSLITMIAYQYSGYSLNKWCKRRILFIKKKKLKKKKIIKIKIKIPKLNKIFFHQCGEIFIVLEIWLNLFKINQKGKLRKKTFD